jgi:hypothetical protein
MLTDNNLYTIMCDEKCWELTNHITSALNAQRNGNGPWIGTDCEGRLNASTVPDREYSFTHL